jgi:hypothetical protein
MDIKALARDQLDMTYLTVPDVGLSFLTVSLLPGRCVDDSVRR